MNFKKRCVMVLFYVEEKGKEPHLRMALLLTKTNNL